METKFSKISLNPHPFQDEKIRLAKIKADLKAYDYVESLKKIKKKDRVVIGRKRERDGGRDIHIISPPYKYTKNTNLHNQKLFDLQYIQYRTRRPLPSQLGNKNKMLGSNLERMTLQEEPMEIPEFEEMSLDSFNMGMDRPYYPSQQSEDRSKLNTMLEDDLQNVDSLTQWFDDRLALTKIIEDDLQNIDSSQWNICMSGGQKATLFKQNTFNYVQDIGKGHYGTVYKVTRPLGYQMVVKESFLTKDDEKKI